MSDPQLLGGVVDDVGRTRVPFNLPTRVAGEAEALAEALEADDLARRMDALTQEIAAITGRAVAHLTPSCTSSLEMGAAIIGVGPGDEVIVPSFAFVTVASAFAQRGATVRFADIDPDSGLISSDHVARLMTSRTRAVVVVHYGGRVLPLDDLDEVLAQRPDVVVVEDCAHSFPYSSPPATNPDAPRRMVVASFHWTKNINCGEGGAIAFDDPGLAEQAQIVYDKGTDRARFRVHEVARYQWVALGSSYSMSPRLVPPLAVQIDHLEAITARRRSRWEIYREALGAVVAERGIRVLDSGESAHTFALIVTRPEERPGLLAHLAGLGIHATSHFEPLHSSPVGREIDPAARCPRTQAFAVSLVRLPLFDALSVDQQQLVIDAVIDATAT